MAPGAISKVASKSVNSAKVSEIVEMAKNTANLGEELGFSSNEIAQLHKAGKLETTIGTTYEHLSPPMRESFERFKKAQDFLEPYKGFMPESQARELIHQAGIRTYPRPQGVPENFRVQISGKGAGMKYVHPQHNHTYVRVMPGKPHSSLAHQQKPYITHIREGKTLDKFGNIVDSKDPAAHILIEEFIYRD